MNRLKNDIEQARADYRAIRYPGDLSQVVGAYHAGRRRRMILRFGTIGGLAAAAAVVLLVTLSAPDPQGRTPPQVAEQGDPTPTMIAPVDPPMPSADVPPAGARSADAAAPKVPITFSTRAMPGIRLSRITRPASLPGVSMPRTSLRRVHDMHLRLRRKQQTNQPMEHAS